MSDLEDSDDEALDAVPFDLNFEFEWPEIANLRTAFNTLADDNGTIDVFSIIA